MAKPYITGYCDPLSVKAGTEVNFMLSGEGVSAADVQLVRIIHGDEHPEGPGFVEAEIASDLASSVTLSHQAVQAGSFVDVPDSTGGLLPDGAFTVHAFIWPTTPNKGPQGLVTQFDRGTSRGYALAINDAGCLCFRSGDGENTAEVALTTPLQAKLWYFVAASYNPDSGRVRLHQRAVINAYNSLLAPILPATYDADDDLACAVQAAASATSLLLAASHDASAAPGARISELYNGKIDRPGIAGGVLDDAMLAALAAGERPTNIATIAYWDTTAGYTAHGIGDVVVDSGSRGLNGQGVNRPIRAMTGYNWNGRDDCFRLDPSQFGGIYFNDDAIVDCAWTPTISFQVPADLKSGVYALRLRSGEIEDHVVFFVRPQKAGAKIAMLMPTASYLAYANEHFALEGPQVELITAHTLMLSDADYFLGQHLEFGRSTYDHHNDGAGVCHSSWRRPIMNLRPRHRMAGTGVPWQFAADLSIIWWLEQCGHDFDVITDGDLDSEGAALLEPYKVVINGTHSEYYSENMMDATDTYVAGGGRVMYLGANGYYWVVAFRPEEPWCMEMRRLSAGSRAWQAAPGEQYMTTNGNRGGLWRDRGRAPQKSMGVGFTSEGMDECKPYRRLPDSYDAQVAWVFDGVGEVFGANGLALGGAAGLELDRYELLWGTPPETFLLAASEGHSDNYPHVGEEVMFNFPGLGGTQDYQIRGDVTLFGTKNGGAVFATGSIAWGQALPWNNGDNDVAQVTQNVLEAFIKDDDPLG